MTGIWHTKTYTRTTGKTYTPNRGDRAGQLKQEMEYVHFVCPGDSLRFQVSTREIANVCAAAPEMLEVLKECLRWINQTEYAAGSIMPEKIEDIIARAEGK
jgi:hypothetical protein